MTKKILVDACNFEKCTIYWYLYTCHFCGQKHCSDHYIDFAISCDGHHDSRRVYICFKCASVRKEPKSGKVSEHIFNLITKNPQRQIEKTYERLWIELKENVRKRRRHCSKRNDTVMEIEYASIVGIIDNMEHDLDGYKENMSS